MNTQLKVLFISISYLLYSVFVTNYILVTALGMAFSLFVALVFLSKIGKEVPIKELIILIASSQWIVGAKISYNIGKVHYKYYMYVEEQLYMSFIVPGIILFYIGLKLIPTDLKLAKLNDYVQKYRQELIPIARTILVIGIFSFLTSRFIQISGLGFIFYLANLLVYVAVAHYMILFPERRNMYFLLTLGFMFLSSLQSGFFHDFILSTTFLVFFLFKERTSLIRKLLFIGVGFSALYTIQLVKGEYRSIIWEGKGNVSAVSAFMEVLEKEFAPGNASLNSINLNKNEETEEQNNLNTRLNQGWIISKIMDNVPKNQEYLGGSTILEALEAAFLPRFLFPNKKGVEDALENFRKISGIDLTKGTSMGLSIIGEFYANFGIIGGWLAIFLYGLFLGLVIKFVITYLGSGSPLILLWFLLFFFQVVKAETELMKVINHLFKSILFFILIRFSLNLFGIRLFQSYRRATN